MLSKPEVSSNTNNSNCSPGIDAFIKDSLNSCQTDMSMICHARVKIKDNFYSFPLFCFPDHQLNSECKSPGITVTYEQSLSKLKEAHTNIMKFFEQLNDK